MFRRRRQPAGVVPVTEQFPPGAGTGAVSALAPVLPAAPSQAGIAGTAGWAPFPGYVDPTRQTGAYSGRLLNQFPANIPGVQLHSGREWGSSNWFYPAVAPVPNGSIQQTQQPVNLPSAQRYGSLFQGPIGPLDAQKNAALVVAAQIRQSGQSALQWAAALNPANQQQQGGS